MNEQTLHMLHEDAINLLKKLIATPSLSKEEDETAEIIQHFLESKTVVTHQYLFGQRIHILMKASLLFY